MEIKILDSILHGDLKPWKLNDNSSRRFGELIKAAKAIEPSTNEQLTKQLSILLQDYPKLQLVLSNATDNGPNIRILSWNTELPKYIDVSTQFYYLLITSETLRLYNYILYQASNWTDLIDIQYQAGKALNAIKVLAQQTNEELNEREYTSAPGAQSYTIHFALYYLKNSLIPLYFSIQEAFKESLQQIITQEDFYMIELQEPLSSMIDLNFTGVHTSGKKETKQKFSFGFNGNPPKLKSVIKQLCIKLSLLNDNVSSEDQLFQAFTSKDLTPGSLKIMIDCETAQFRYLIDCLKLHFDNLNFASIEKASIFFSKNDTPIKAQNLYSSKVANPKTKEDIDEIINQLQ